MEPRHETVGAWSTFWRETHFLRQLFSAVRNIHKTKSATCFHCCRAHQRYSQTHSHSTLSLSRAVIFTSSIRHLVVSLRPMVPLLIFFVCYFWLQSYSGNRTNTTMQCTKCSQNPIRVRKVQSLKVEETFAFNLKIYKFKAKHDSFLNAFVYLDFPENMFRGSTITSFSTCKK